MSGIELNIFDYLSEPISATAVAKTLKGHPANTETFLNGLAAIDLVQKKQGLYRNSPLAQTFLVRGTETYLGSQLVSTLQTFSPILDGIPALVKEGTPPVKESTNVLSEEFWMQLTRDIANSERGGSARQAAEIVAGLPEFASFQRMLDLGGGPGIIGMAIVAAHPTMRGTIFDRPSIVKVAETFIQEYAMADRLDVLGGDYLTDPIGEGYDLIWTSACLNFAIHAMDSLMAKIYAALNPGGVFISCAEGLTHERTAPALLALQAVPQALSGQDIYFNQGFIADAMLRAGFKSVRSSTLDTIWGPMDLDVGRKA
jgi:hypothetical protein